MEFAAQLVGGSILIAAILLWARWSKLDLGLRRPSFTGVWPWIALFILWCAVEVAVQEVHPVEVSPKWLAWMDRLSLPEILMVVVVLNPLFEELLFRGALFSALIRRWGLWVAVLVPSLLWGLTHLHYEAWLAASIAGSGVVLAIVRWKSGSLYVPLVLHAAFNLFVMLAPYPLFQPAD